MSENQHLRFGVMVDARLRSETRRLPVRVYTRPLSLRPGMVLEPASLAHLLNRLRYSEHPDMPVEAGQFAVSEAGVTFFPRPVADGAVEPLLVSFATDKQRTTRVRENRSASNKRLAEQALEPELVTYLYDEDREKRRRVHYEELPDHLDRAVLAIEDRRFFSHPGLDPIRLVAAAIRNLRSDSAIPHGGSTITQQLCKTGTKMIHIGKRSRSTIVSKGISAGRGNNSYRGQVKVMPKADGARNYTQCDSMLIGNRCGAHTFPYIDVQNPSSRVEHEASTSKIGEDQIFYLKQRGLNTEHAISVVVNGFAKEVFKELPMEFAVEAQKLLGISLEGSVG